MRKKQDEKIEHIQAFRPLAFLSEAQRRRLARAAELIDAPAGTVLQEPGERRESWWIVTRGVIALEAGSSSTVLKAGEGWGASETLRRQVTGRRAVALTDSRCLLVAGRDLEELLQDVPALAVCLLRRPDLGAAH